MRHVHVMANAKALLLSLAVFGCVSACTPHTTNGAPLSKSLPEVRQSDAIDNAAAGPVVMRPPTQAPERQYEPEPTEPAAVLSPAQAKMLLGLYRVPSKQACAKWAQPLGSRCRVEGRDPTTALVESLAPDASVKREVTSRRLFELEGCASLPSGLVRWVRMRHLTECRVELGQAVFATGASILQPELVNTLAGETLADKCQRSIEPMPPYPHDEFTPERFARFRQRQIEPWQKRTHAALQRCRTAVDGLAFGDHGRAEAELGYVQALRNVARMYRAAHIPRRLAANYEQRRAYYEAIDDVARPHYEHLDALLPSVTAHSVAAGEYALYVEVFLDAALGRQSFEWLSLSLPEPRAASSSERALRRLPVAASMLVFGAEELASEPALRVLIARGLPQMLRAELGNRLKSLDRASHERQRLHALLALGLTRLGLVSHSRAALERALYELSFAGRGVEERWLAAVVRALLTPGAELDVFPDWTHPRRQLPLDRSGFTPDLLELGNSNERYAPLVLDHAILGFGADAAVKDAQALLAAAARSGVPGALQNCVRAALSDDWSTYEFDDGQGPRCVPFVWLVR